MTAKWYRKKNTISLANIMRIKIQKEKHKTKSEKWTKKFISSSNEFRISVDLHYLFTEKENYFLIYAHKYSIECNHWFYTMLCVLWVCFFISVRFFLSAFLCFNEKIERHDYINAVQFFFFSSTKIEFLNGKEKHISPDVCMGFFLFRWFSFNLLLRKSSDLKQKKKKIK